MTDSCKAGREAIHRLLDAEIIDAEEKQRLEVHLSGCSACREFEADMRAIQGTLRATPEIELSEKALEQVWSRTTAGTRRIRWNGLAAAAAVAAIALLSIWRFGGPEPQAPSDYELQRAARQARMVLKLTARALHRSEQAAIRDVLTDEVSPALRKVPIDWPAPQAARERGS